MKYSKGDWKVREAEKGLGFEVYRQIAPHIVDVIAERVLKDDAYLMAAAKNMYEAGQELDLAIGQGLIMIAKTFRLGQEWVNIVQTIILPAQEKWRKALAKAEGK